MPSARLPIDVPRFVAHYAGERPFHSMMDLHPTERAALLRAGVVPKPERYGDPAYVDTRARVESALYEQFQAAGGRPEIRHPHYALMGRSARVEASIRPGDRVCLMGLDALAPEKVSFTWGDSFCFDPRYRHLLRCDHPAMGRTYRLADLPEILERFRGTTARPGWQEIEVQLWFQPVPGQYRVVEGAPGDA